MLHSEVKASKERMESGDMKSFFFNDRGEQIRGQWTFLRNIDSRDPKRSFFPNLQTRTTEETQNRRGKMTPSSQVATTEEQEDRSRDKDKTSEKATGARTRTTGRSKSPRAAEIPAITETADSQNENEEEEEGGCWNNVGRGKSKRGRGGNGAGAGRGRGADAGAGAKRGKGREDPSQPSMRNFIPDPRERLATGGWS